MTRTRLIVVSNAQTRPDITKTRILGMSQKLLSLDSFLEETKEMRLARLKAEREIFESERPQRIAKLLESAKSQIETPEYKMETRLVEFAEKFYPKYCGVTLTREQINQMRLIWKQINIDNKQKNVHYESNLNSVSKNINKRLREETIRSEFEGIANCMYNDPTENKLTICGNCVDKIKD